MNESHLMDMNSLTWMKSDCRIVWPMGGYSFNGFNRSVSNLNSSMLIFDSSIKLLKFPNLDIPKEEERNNTIFDPTESLVNSAKNTESIIVKTIHEN